jgi:hypothetical protein
VSTNAASVGRFKRRSRGTDKSSKGQADCTPPIWKPAARSDLVGSGSSSLEPTYGVALFEPVVEDRFAGEEDDDATTSHV